MTNAVLFAFATLVILALCSMPSWLWIAAPALAGFFAFKEIR